jgi:hypothetical protein
VDRFLAHHLAVRADHPSPVQSEFLAVAVISEGPFGPSVHSIPVEDLDHHPVGPESGAIGFKNHHAVVQEQDRDLVRVVGGIDPQGVDGVVQDRGVAVLGNERCLAAGCGGTEEHQGGSEDGG